MVHMDEDLDHKDEAKERTVAGHTVVDDTERSRLDLGRMRQQLENEFRSLVSSEPNIANDYFCSLFTDRQNQKCNEVFHFVCLFVCFPSSN